MNWDLIVSWIRITRTQTQVQEHKPKNYKKKIIKKRKKRENELDIKRLNLEDERSRF